MRGISLVTEKTPRNRIGDRFKKKSLTNSQGVTFIHKKKKITRVYNNTITTGDTWESANMMYTRAINHICETEG